MPRRPVRPAMPVIYLRPEVLGTKILIKFTYGSDGMQILNTPSIESTVDDTWDTEQLWWFLENHEMIRHNLGKLASLRIPEGIMVVTTKTYGPPSQGYQGECTAYRIEFDPHSRRQGSDSRRNQMVIWPHQWYGICHYVDNHDDDRRIPEIEIGLYKADEKTY